VSKHVFVDSGRTRIGTTGRRLRLCAECGGVALGTGHARPKKIDAYLTLQQYPGPRGAPGAPLPDPWQVPALLHAAELVLALPEDAVGWRFRLRVLDVVRAAKEGKDDLPLRRDPAIDEPLPVRGAAPVATTRGSQRAQSRKLLRGLDTRWRELAERALDEGWQIRTTGTGHLRFEAPTGKVVITPASPGEGRGYLNARSQFKRHGLNTEGL
jgi:hypothetical protein